MPFNIADFKSEVTSKGFMRPSTFEVFLNKPGGDDRAMTFKTESINLPGIAFFSADNYRPYAAGKVLSVAWGYNPSPIQMTHQIDANGDTIKYLYDWASKIVNVNGDNNFSSAYYNDYITDMEAIIYSGKEGNTETKIKIFEAYPTSIDQLPLGWNETDRILTINVSYAYANYIIE